ncbi:MAG: hypothetical protein K2Q22_03765, partial [Cytophagales bacterium]|nr:hypothetical protein [Cytophagales bacterium]
MPCSKYLFLVLLLWGYSDLYSQSKDWNYPYTPKEDVFDTYWGKTINDPYRWLENDTLKRTKEWVLSQNELTKKYMDEQLKEFPLVLQLHDLSYADFGSLHKDNGYYFNYVRYHGFQYPILEIKKNTWDEGAVAIDP